MMAFDPKPPFAVRKFSRCPILCGGDVADDDKENSSHQVVFCGSLEREGEGWRIFFGENDRRIRFGHIPDSLIFSEMEEV